MIKYTYGDDQELACPHCKHEHCFQDWVAEGWNGEEYACDKCGKMFLITVDWSVDLMASAEVAQ